MRILLIEDEEGISAFLKQGLEEEGFTVLTAYEGDTGMEYALTQTYDLLLLDWMLPGKTGLQISKEVRARGIEAPIIFLTAKDSLQDTIEGLQAGANDYIKKPFHFEELLERIRVQLRDKHSAPEELQLDELVLRPKSREAFLNGQAIELTQREYDLLLFLLSHKDRVCSRKEIIEKVWDIHFDYDTGIIDVYINAIRKKLGAHSPHNYIKTVRGIGYQARGKT